MMILSLGLEEIPTKDNQLTFVEIFHVPCRKTLKKDTLKQSQKTNENSMQQYIYKVKRKQGDNDLLES